MALFETVTIDAMVAACDGVGLQPTDLIRGGGVLGHPKVYLNLAPSGKAECPYCSRLFVNPAMLAGSGRGAAEAGSPTGDASAPRR